MLRFVSHRVWGGLGEDTAFISAVARILPSLALTRGWVGRLIKCCAACSARGQDPGSYPATAGDSASSSTEVNQVPSTAWGESARITVGRSSTQTGYRTKDGSAFAGA